MVKDLCTSNRRNLEMKDNEEKRIQNYNLLLNLWDKYFDWYCDFDNNYSKNNIYSFI